MSSANKGYWCDAEMLTMCTFFPATGKSRAGQRYSAKESKFCSWVSASKQQLRIVPATCNKTKRFEKQKKSGDTAIW